jgi:hypothetical protein
VNGVYSVCSTFAGGWQVADKRRLGMRVKRPQGNALVLAILRSRVHRLLSGLAVELRYTGRRSGRTYALPVQYARTGDRLILWPQGADRKSWWRNFRTPGPVMVRLAGRGYREPLGWWRRPSRSGKRSDRCTRHAGVACSSAWPGRSWWSNLMQTMAPPPDDLTARSDGSMTVLRPGWSQGLEGRDTALPGEVRIRGEIRGV